MIVLDEQLQGLGLEEEISRWYRGAVLLVRDLRPSTVIKDESIPTLLRQAKKPTFVTINYSDFWRKCKAENSYSVVCLKLSTEEYRDVSPWLRELLRIPEFKTKKARLGKVILMSYSLIQYYAPRENVTHFLNRV